ncbi:MAG: hypothetical protein J6S41_02150, partial [Clostridia bacterium]|nr:hypothetical protein [Clostridia bacterium]
VDETVEIIKGIKKYYEGFHGLNISDEVARAAAILSEKYIHLAVPCHLRE